MTKILFDCPTCGTLRTIRVDGPATLVKFSCSACHLEYRLEMKLSRVLAALAPKLAPKKKPTKKETKSDEAVDNGRKKD